METPTLEGPAWPTEAGRAEARFFSDDSCREDGARAPGARTIAIVGAGFSGTVVALNLLKLAHEQPLRVLLVDRSHVGRGVAYASRAYPYLLNVPAGRMSASSEDPLNFLSFVQRRTPGSDAHAFVPRERYGEYLRWALASAQMASPPHVKLRCVTGSAIGIERLPNASLRIHLADGRKLTAHTAVLALGNPRPARLSAAESVRGSSRYIEDPWAVPVEFQPRETVLIAGTGLTMADIALAGNESANARAVIFAISRHGLIPPPQTNFTEVTDERYRAALLHRVPPSVTQLFRATRALAEEATRRGGDWRAVVALVRALAPTLWHGLPEPERRRFLRHARVYWDLHRHRMPPSAWGSIEQMRRTGALHVQAGRLIAMQLAGKRIRVRWRGRGEDRLRTVVVDRVVNCTGPDYDLRTTRDRLLRSLIARGMALPDPLGLGLLTDEFGALKTASGRRNPLYYVGPMLRADHWETTAVQELRVCAEQLARHLAAPTAVAGDLSTGAVSSDCTVSVAGSPGPAPHP